jgi:hypothetical protein
MDTKEFLIAESLMIPSIVLYEETASSIKLPACVLLSEENS